MSVNDEHSGFHGKGPHRELMPPPNFRNSALPDSPQEKPGPEPIFSRSPLKPSPLRRRPPAVKDSSGQIRGFLFFSEKAFECGQGFWTYVMFNALGIRTRDR